MLLFDLIKNNITTSGLPKFVINDCTRNSCEQKHIKENEHNIEDIVRLVILNS